MKRLVFPLIVLGALAGVFWRYPPIRIVRLSDPEATKEQGQGAVDATALAGKLWDEKLAAAIGGAYDADEVIAAIRKDPEAAGKSFGRKVGISRGYFYLVRGKGAITSVEKNKVGVALEDSEQTDVALATGPIFGNAVRDATGLAAANDFPNSQDFNAISQELNRRVETEAAAPLAAGAKAGQRLHFVAAIEATSAPAGSEPMKAIPIVVRFDP